MRSIFAKDALPMARASFSFVRTKRAQACPSSKPEQCYSHYSPSTGAILPTSSTFCPIDSIDACPSPPPMRVFRGSAYIVLAKSLGCHSPWSISVEETPTSTQRTATAKISASHGLLMSLVVSHGFFGRVPP